MAFNKIKSVIICIFFYFSVFSPGIFFSQTEHTPDTKTVNYSVTQLPSSSRLYYYKKENATLEEDFFVRTKDELVPVEVKANKNRSKSLRKLIDNESYSDIKWGIKLADSNVGIENGIYTFPYFCSFLIKRYLAKRG